MNQTPLFIVALLSLSISGQAFAQATGPHIPMTPKEQIASINRAADEAKEENADRAYTLHRWLNVPECSEVVTAVAKLYPDVAPPDLAKSGRILLGSQPVKVQCFETKWWETGIFTSDEIHRMRDLAFVAAVKRIVQEVKGVLNAGGSAADVVKGNLANTVSLVLEANNTDVDTALFRKARYSEQEMVLNVKISPNFGIQSVRFPGLAWKTKAESDETRINHVMDVLSERNPTYIETGM